MWCKGTGLPVDKKSGDEMRFDVIRFDAMAMRRRGMREEADGGRRDAETEQINCFPFPSTENYPRLPWLARPASRKQTPRLDNPTNTRVEFCAFPQS